MRESQTKNQRNKSSSKVININDKRKKNGINPIIIIALVIAAIIIGFLVVGKIKGQKPIDLYAGIFETVYKETNIDINKYIVYGTHLNLEGTSEKIYTVDKIRGVNLLLKSLDGEKEFKYMIDYNLNDKKLEFSSSDLINKGINLEELPVGIYVILIDVEHFNGIHRLYTFNNLTEYSETEYYTITKNGKNNKIDIGFDKYIDSSNNEFNYMFIKVEEAQLPENVYDIVIDAGHGGTDSGAVNGDYEEADIVLDYAVKLKEEMEKIGLKVFLTRDGSEPENEKTAYTMYDENGRVNIACGSKAKYSLSLHLNSNKENIEDGGVEIYSPSKSDLSFAKSLADNIVTVANTTYSKNYEYKKDEGVYVQTLSKYSIESSRKSAEKAGYEPYDLTTDTPSLYMIRELGGICTNAYMDGRNKIYGANKFVNSNIGIESYLLELGYINNEEDLNNILQNQDLYIQAIVESVKDRLLENK